MIKIKDLFYKYSIGAKPFLKWAGGKGQLLRIFDEFYPSELKQKKSSIITNHFLVEEPYSLMLHKDMKLKLLIFMILMKN